MGQKRGFGLWLVIGVLSLTAVGTIRNIIRLYEASGRVKQAEKELADLKLKKEEAEKKLQESQKEEFLERIAREKLGMGLPGEVVVIMDNNQKSKDPMIQTKPALRDQKSNEDVPNWQKWRRLYLGF